MRSVHRASRYFILLMAVSFLGWAVETVFFLLCYGSFYDRGFMTLPFCTIYGVSFLLLYGLMGSPGERRGERWNRACAACGYFLLCALIPTALELLTGLFFHRALGIRLWSYEAYRFHFNGYICLEYALLWGLLLPVCMEHIFLPLKKAVFALPLRCALLLSAGLGALSLADWAVNFSRQEWLL